MLKMKIKNLWMMLLFAVLAVLVSGVVLIIGYLGYLYYGGLKATENLAKEMLNSEMESALTEVFDKVEFSPHPYIDVHPTKGTGFVQLYYKVERPLTVDDIDALIAAFEKKGYIKAITPNLATSRDGKFIHSVTMAKPGKISPFAISGLRIEIRNEPEFSIMVDIGSQFITTQPQYTIEEAKDLFLYTIKAPPIDKYYMPHELKDVIVGAGIGECDGAPCIKVYVKEKTPEIEKSIPREIEGYKIDIEETGEIKAFQK